MVFPIGMAVYQSLAAQDGERGRDAELIGLGVENCPRRVG